MLSLVQGQSVLPEPEAVPWLRVLLVLGARCTPEPPTAPGSWPFAHLVLEEELGLRGAALTKHTKGNGALVPSGAVGDSLPQFTDVDIVAQGRQGWGQGQGGDEALRCIL